jgi:DNA-binding CsgD family transcriptional regulator
VTDPQLSRREREIAQLMAEGMSYSQIAGVIGWTPDSVRVTAHRAACKIPGRGTPYLKLILWALKSE